MAVDELTPLDRRKGRRLIEQRFDSRASGRDSSRSLVQRLDEPGPGQLPVAFNGRIGHVQRLGHLLIRHTGKELHLNDLRLTGVELGKLRERRVQVQDIGE
jgi:hypothetical protein